MDKQDKKLYSKGEEIFNGVTHIIGGALGIVFLIVFIILSVVNNIDTIGLISLIVFGSSTIILYTMSSLYHMISNRKAKSIFRIFDHLSIYILIIGTYTPYILICLRNIYGYIILGFVLLLGIIGIVFNSINMHNKIIKIYSYISYVLMGWSIIIAMPLLLEVLARIEFYFLLLGGISYTFGLLFYFLGSKLKWWHSIWHLFVLFGTIFQFVSLLLIVI